MGVITEHRLKQVRGLIAVLPEAPLRSLDGALALTHDPALLEVRQIIVDERERRQVKGLVFAPYLPLFQPREDELNSILFPDWLLTNLWRALSRHEPGLMDEAMHTARTLSRGDPTPVVFFRLVTAGAELLRTAAAEILPPRPAKGDAEEVAEFAEYLDLHRIVRDALSRLPDWMGRIDPQSAATLRLLYKDACVKSDDSGARFMEVLYANLDDGVQIMKLIAAVIDRPNDRFLSESELADFGERILERIDERLLSLRQRLDKGSRNASEDPHAAGAEVNSCLALMHTLQQAIELSREGPWGIRVAQAHKTIATLVEGRLKSLEKTVLQALPTKPSRGGLARPKLEATISEPDLQKAQAALTFLSDVRNQASQGGYASLHTRTVQSMEVLMDSYVEDLLAIANGDDPFDSERLADFFDAVVSLYEAAFGEDRANLIRRRIASSGLYRSDHVA